MHRSAAGATRRRDAESTLSTSLPGSRPRLALGGWGAWAARPQGGAPTGVRLLLATGELLVGRRSPPGAPTWQVDDRRVPDDRAGRVSDSRPSTVPVPGAGHAAGWQ